MSTINELEQAVIDAAVKRRQVERLLFPLGAPESGSGQLNRLFVAEQMAVDALIAALGGVVSKESE